MIKTKPDTKFKKEDKQGIKMIKTKPDMNQITYEEEKAALILGITTIFTVWQMIYFLLVSVIKYIYIKIPTPLVSTHKF